MNHRKSVLLDLDFPFAEFCEIELPLYGVLGSSLSSGNAQPIAKTLLWSKIGDFPYAFRPSS
jgi:hypothetical protein